MPKLDAFTQRRVVKFVEEFRSRSGQLPTLGDFANEGFDKPTVEDSLKDGILEEFYITLTSGAVVKVYKLKN